MAIFKIHARHVFCLLFFVSLHITNGQILAREQFELTTGSINGRGSGTGWYVPAPNWVTQNGSANYMIASTDQLSFTGVETVGNYLTGGLFESTGRYIAGPEFAPFLINGRIGLERLYFTFLIRKEQDNDFAMEVTLTDSPANAYEVVLGAEHIKIGYFGEDSNNGGERYWSLAVDNETQLVLTNTPIVIDQTYRMVVEIDFGDVGYPTDDTTVNLWVDANVGEVLPTTPDASVTSSSDLAFWNIVLFFDGNEAGQGSFDEFVFSDDLSVVLPVELSHFSATTSANEVTLNWTTESELSNDKFIIERSTNGIHWSDIGSVPGHGNSTTTINYSFKDFQPTSLVNYYRLRQIDFDGAFEYSEIIRVSSERWRDIKFFKRDDGVLIRSSSPIQTIQLLSLDGQLHQSITVEGEEVMLDNLRKELLYILIMEIDGQIISRKISL